MWLLPGSFLRHHSHTQGIGWWIPQRQQCMYIRISCLTPSALQGCVGPLPICVLVVMGSCSCCGNSDGGPRGGAGRTAHAATHCLFWLVSWAPMLYCLLPVPQALWGGSCCWLRWQDIVAADIKPCRVGGVQLCLGLRQRLALAVRSWRVLAGLQRADCFAAESRYCLPDNHWYLHKALETHSGAELPVLAAVNIGCSCLTAQCSCQHWVHLQKAGARPCVVLTTSVTARNG